MSSSISSLSILIELFPLDVQALLFGLMATYGYGVDPYVRRFRMVMQFHQSRIPLVILLSGTG